MQLFTIKSHLTFERTKNLQTDGERAEDEEGKCGGQDEDGIYHFKPT